MALIHDQSEVCVKTELDLFTVPFTQASIENSTFIEIVPPLAITEMGPLEFYMSNSGEENLDLNFQRTIHRKQSNCGINCTNALQFVFSRKTAA